VRAAVEESLDNLGGRIDLYLIHWPLPRFDRFVRTYEELICLRDEGLIQEVGVSNFKPHHIKRLIAATNVAPTVNQIQLDLRHARFEAQAFHRSLDITTQAWSPIKDTTVFKEPRVLGIASKHDCSPAQVVLAWHMRQGVVPLVMSATPAHQKENLAAAEVTLDADDVASLSMLDLGEAAARDSDQEEWM
jgi:diketogulonate reductase-like aldo/keto reductase